MLARGEFGLDAEIDSDTRPLWPAVDALLDAAGAGAPLHARRDPRRRRLGAQRARPRVGRRDRSSREARRAGAARRSPAPREILGIDPMYVANEGVLVAFVAPEAADAALAALARGRPAASGAAEIGEVKTEPPGMVLVETAFGGRRVMDLLVGDPLPRIC